MSTPIRSEFMVPECNIDRLERDFAKLAKRAARIGCPVPTLEIGAERIRTEKDRTEESGLTRHVVTIVRRCTVTGERPRFAGWTFLAKIAHVGATDEGSAMTLLLGMGGAVPEQYRTAAPDCDHCQASRKRSETFLVQHEDGTIKQVGRSCLADFLGHEDPASLVAMAEIMAGIERLGLDCSEGGGGTERTIDLVDFLSWCAQSIRVSGWVSKAVERATSKPSTASDAVGCRRRYWKDGKGTLPSTKDEEIAAGAIAWALDVLPTSDYLHNLVTIVRLGFVDDRMTGLAASLLVAYDRELARRREVAESNHFGTVGKREVFRFTVDKIVTIEGGYGVTYLHLMHDAAGNVATWKSSRERIERDGEVALKCTVKRHGEYKGRKQTELSRCTLVD